MTSVSGREIAWLRVLLHKVAIDKQLVFLLVILLWSVSGAIILLIVARSALHTSSSETILAGTLLNDRRGR